MSLISSPKDPKTRTSMFRFLCLASSLLLVHLSACAALIGNDESSGEQPATRALSPVPAADVVAIIDAYTSECVLADMQRAVLERNGVHNKRLDQLRQNIRNRPLIAYEKRYPFLKVLSCDLGEVHGALNQYSDAAATSEFIFNAGVEVATNARNIAERYILTPGGQLALTFAGPGLLHGGRALFNPRVVIVLLALTALGITAYVTVNRNKIDQLRFDALRPTFERSVWLLLAAAAAAKLIEMPQLPQADPQVVERVRRAITTLTQVFVLERVLNTCNRNWQNYKHHPHLLQGGSFEFTKIGDALMPPHPLSLGPLDPYVFAAILDVILSLFSPLTKIPCSEILKKRLELEGEERAAQQYVREFEFYKFIEPLRGLFSGVNYIDSTMEWWINLVRYIMFLQ